jgi:small-conductance mechanosensitive channel
LDDLAVKLAENTNLFLIFILSLFAGSIVLTFPLNVRAWINAIAVIVFLIQLAIWGNVAIEFGLVRYQKKNEEETEEITTLKALGLVARIALFSILALVALDNIPGVEITALVASLGITGVAVALAVNQILGDLFASISIALDKPFVIGDFIIVGDFMGSVEDIGLKTTRVRSLDGEEIIFSNSDLLDSRIRNFKDMSERRVIFTLGVTYETPQDKLERIPSLIQELVEMHEIVRFDSSHFKQFGDFSIIFEAIYYVLDPDFSVYLDVNEKINMDILRRFSAEGIEFAYPTRTIYMGKTTNGSGVQTELQQREPV